METKQPADEQEKLIKTTLLKEEFSTCVCCRLCSKSSIEGWQAKVDQKTSKKRVDVSRGNQGLLRRERTITTAPKGDFLFRHYDSSDRYIKQYRENYTSSCAIKESYFNGVGPVLGVDFPDPYLPKIASSSILIERIKIIEALSSYYNTDRENVKNISLTGKRTCGFKGSNADTSSSKKSQNILPQIERNTNVDKENRNCNTGCLPTVADTEDEEKLPEKQSKPSEKDNFTSITEKAHFQRGMKDILRVTSNGTDDHRNIENSMKFAKKESLILPAAKLVCNDETAKPRNMENNQTTKDFFFPSISFWSEFHPLKNNKPDKVLDKLRIGKKVMVSDEKSSEVLCDENLNLRSLETRESLQTRGGNLCLGKTVRPVTNHKEQQRKLKNNKNSSTDKRLQQICRNTNENTKETAFIRILGEPKGPLPLVKDLTKTEQTQKPKANQPIRKDCGIPLTYLRRLGRRRFHHVLEARSYKPETRKLGAAVIPN